MSIRKALLIAAALATAWLLYAVVAANDGPNPMAPPRRDDRLYGLGILAFGFAGLIAVPGAILTFFYIRKPDGWLRVPYHALLYFIVVANVLLLTSGARGYASMFCLTCGLEMWWTQTIVPASLYVVLGPAATAFFARPPASRQSRRPY